MAQVELDLFSGRPNPAWQLDESRTRQLQQLVASLSPASTGPPDPPGLGYRGFRIRVGDRLYRVWDGHVPIHEVTNDEHVVTWLFEPESMVPLAKIDGHKAYSVLPDPIGAPRQLFDETGELAWSAELDPYGNARVAVAKTPCPWRWPVITVRPTWH